MARPDPLAGVRIIRSSEVGPYSPLQELAFAMKRRGVPPERFADELALTSQELIALHYDLNATARPIQQQPSGIWRRWLATGGRGAGKTFCSAKLALDELAADKDARILLIGPTFKNIMETNLEGSSGILTIAAPWLGVAHQPSKKRVAAKSGARILYIPAEAGPARFKGLAFSLVICDEVVAWENDPCGVGEEVCTIARYRTPRMRKLGIPARVAVTSTPEPSDLFRLILEDKDGLVVTQMSSFENTAHLDEHRLKTYRSRLGTRLGRQEYLGELNFEALTAGLFSKVDFQATAVATDAAPDRYARIIIGFDPVMGGVSGRVDESGIVVVGVHPGADGQLHAYVLEDASFKTANPREAAERVVARWRHWSQFADKAHVIVEMDKGGEATVQLLRMVEPSIRLEPVLARKHGDKVARAMPLASLFEIGLVHLVGDQRSFKGLTEQMRDFDGAENKKDGRVDACAYPVLLYVWRSRENRGAMKAAAETTVAEAG